MKEPKTGKNFPILSVAEHKRLNKKYKPFSYKERAFKKVAPKKYMEMTTGKSGLIRGLTIDEV